jgi:hypothetical protein
LRPVPGTTRRMSLYKQVGLFLLLTQSENGQGA